MNPAELIARITAQTKSFQPTGNDFTRLTAEDVLHALGKIKHKHAGLVLRVKFADQKELLRDLEIAFWLVVVDLSNQEKWKYPKNMVGKEFYRKMAKLAISENIDPQICSRCNGTKAKTVRGKVYDCGPCNGTGHTVLSERSRARFLGLNREAYRYTWSERYTQVVSLFADWERLGLGAVKKRLRTH